MRSLKNLLSLLSACDQESTPIRGDAIGVFQGNVTQGEFNGDGLPGVVVSGIDRVALLLSAP